MKLDLPLGAQVYCQDEPCGKLVKVVVDPATQQVTDLIVEKGLLLKHAYVLPVVTVDRMDGHDLYLTVHSAELSHYPEYRETTVREPAAGVTPARGALSAELGMGAEPTVPLVRKRLREGIATGKTVIGRKTEVDTLHGAIGYVDHILMDTQNGKIAGVVMRKGLFPEYVVIPLEEIGEVSTESVFVDLSQDELAALPRYHPRSPAEILAAVQQQLQEGWPAFTGVEAACTGGVVHLTGYVQSKALAYHAAELAQVVDGVFDVQNELVVDPAFTPGERGAETVDLARQVHHALLADPRTAHAVIDVVKDRTTIILQGKVADVATRQAAETIARQQLGVTAVDNELVVPRETIAS